MSIEFVESKPVEITVQTKPLRYGEHRPLRLDEYSLALRGRQLTVVYARNGINYFTVVVSPLQINDTLNVGIEKIRAALLNAKLSLSSVVNVTVNHGDGHEACRAIVRRAIAARS